MYEEKEREEKERVEGESASPPSIYNAPPFDVALHEVNRMEQRRRAEEGYVVDEEVEELSMEAMEEKSEM